jgi:prefoldin subunit 5
MRKEAQQHQEKLREGREATASAEAAAQHIARLEGQVQGLQASRGTLHNLVSALKTSQDELRAAHGRLGQVLLIHSGAFLMCSSYC